jgi:hypothetical protein
MVTDDVYPRVPFRRNAASYCRALSIPVRQVCASQLFYAVKM